MRSIPRLMTYKMQFDNRDRANYHAALIHEIRGA